MEGVRALREDFAVDVFDDIKMREYLPHDSYKRLTGLLKRGEHRIIDVQLANDVATGMKNWAVSRGATHFSHWFQPMTGETAEKQESFIGHFDPLGRPLLEFSGEILVRGEPDASSFPNGGLRCTHAARGYTLWDPQSPAFLRHYKHASVLCVPTAFSSWTGEALDYKVPFLKSEESVAKEALRTLRYLGDTESKTVFTTLGCEQEFFVINKDKFNHRLDLKLTGRTVIGAKPCKGQELEDQYFNVMPPKVMEMVQDMEISLWRLGVPSKTRHNEVAPAQHEIAPVYEPSGIAIDHQLLTMTILQEKARDHGFEALLHEKPFSYVNGSGKHNNWSMCTDLGANLLDPGNELLKHPHQAFDGLANSRFTVFLAAFLQAIDNHGPVIRCAIASHSNDLRLGANEAPPAIMSVYLGTHLTNFVDGVIDVDALKEDSFLSPNMIKQRTQAILNDDINFAQLPTLRRDRTDRNRTSPCAFVSNKFELRAVGSSFNSAVPVTAMNAAMCLSLRKINEQVEALLAQQPEMSAKSALQKVTVETLKAHYRVIFDGNGYSPEWVAEAEKRGLTNYRTTPEALEKVDQKPLYLEAGVFTEKEVNARVNVALEAFNKNMHIEAKTMVNLAETLVLPAAEKTILRLAECARVAGGGFKARLDKLVSYAETVMHKIADLKELTKHHSEDLLEEAKMIDKKFRPAMAELRAACDAIEVMVPAEDWKMPTYNELLFGVC